MKFKLEVEIIDEGSRHWETYDEDTNDAQKWSEELIAWFNGTCRQGESHRKLLNVELL